MVEHTAELAATSFSPVDQWESDWQTKSAQNILILNKIDKKETNKQKNPNIPW